MDGGGSTGEGSGLGWDDTSSWGCGWGDGSVNGWLSDTWNSTSSAGWLGSSSIAGDWDESTVVDSDGLLCCGSASTLLRWLNEPNDWGGIDNSGDGLAEGSGGGSNNGDGCSWESLGGGVGITGWVWGNSWCWLDAVTSESE